MKLADPTIARRLAVGCLLPAALTPKADWHERWKHGNAAAFRFLCGEISAADPWDVLQIWEQRDELVDGLRKRVAERLSLLTCQDDAGATVENVKAMLAAIAERRRA